MPSRLSTGSWHDGELQMHRILKAPTNGYANADGLPTSFGMRVVQSPIIAVGTMDADENIWTTIWGSQRGFAQPIAEDVLGMRSKMDMKYDPVAKAILADRVEGGMQLNGGRGKLISGLAIDLETRDRVKLMGRMVALAEEPGETGNVQMGVHIEESLGNCPKYLNKKDIVPNDDMNPQLVGDGEGALHLSQEALDLVYKADLFFLSSEFGGKMDTNHRGGAPGFLKVLKNEDGQVELLYPECKFPLFIPLTVTNKDLTCYLF